MKNISNAYYRDRDIKNSELLKKIKKKLPKLEKLLETANDHWNYEDLVYRYYHGSFKVYYLQGLTNEIVKTLKSISPHKDKNYLNEDFLEILNAGTGKVWEHSHNQEWSKHCRPILEAFFHAKYFLEMAVKYGKELKEAPNVLPSGWAGLLYLYKIR